MFYLKDTLLEQHSQVKLEVHNDKKISGVLVEPIQGEGGVIPGSNIFFKSLWEICDKYNLFSF